MIMRPRLFDFRFKIMFDINYTELFKSLPPEAAVMLIAFVPVAELRASIPIALGAYKMSAAAAIFWSVLADVILAAVIIYFLDFAYKKISGKLEAADKFFAWLFARTRKKFYRKHKAWGNVALILFVAVPLPITGVWTGSLASWLFGIPKGKSLLYVSLGAAISAVIVTLISLGIFSIF